MTVIKNNRLASDLLRRASVFMLLLVMGHSAYAVDLKRESEAVVKLFVTSQSWNMHQPWEKTLSRKGNCTGFFIKEGILTNAHCVKNATFIEMEVLGNPDKMEVEQVAINHQVDLALLRPIDPTLVEHIKPITFGPLPELRAKVVTVGYPMGGRQLSYTEGIVSRIDIMIYAHSGMGGLAVQTDAAINPGNSGGPVFSDTSGDILGVATQRSRSGEAIGYFIPASVVEQFLFDIEDEKVDGVPALGGFFQALENPSMREQMNMPEGLSGVRVFNTAKDSSFDGLVEKDDVLLEIDGHKIYNDGRVPFRGNGKIGIGYHLVKHQVGDELSIKLLREGEIMNLLVKLNPYRLSLIKHQPQYDERPKYYVIGGLMFRNVGRRYMSTWGNANKTPPGIRRYIGSLYGEDDLEEVVVLGRIFAADVNKGFEGVMRNARIMTVNGMAITQLSDLATAFEVENDSQYHEIEIEGGARVVLSKTEIAASEADIRARYNIPAENYY